MNPLVISSDRLTVEIAAPGTAYTGSRFDWTAFITQVTLDNRHTFCVPEATDGTGTGGIGLCAEFGITRPLGYHLAKPGDCFPKLGTGLLVREDTTDYFFANNYSVKPFPVKIDTDGDKVNFTVEPVDCNGIAARLEKTLSVKGARLSISYRLENTGTLCIETDEYVHNFVAVDSCRMNKGYSLEFTGSLEFNGLDKSISQAGSILDWQLPTEGKFFRGHALPHTVDSFRWCLSHKPTGCSVTETVTGPVTRFHLYGTPELVSPEVFVDISLKPGSSMQWERVYDFSDASENNILHPAY